MAKDSVSLPTWAVRIRRERETREWTVPKAIDSLVAHATAEESKALPSRETLTRRWREWEAGDHRPGEFYQPMIARTFGTARYALFPQPSRGAGDADLLIATGMDTLDIVTRMRTSDIDSATLEALRLTVDRLCGEYAYKPAEQLVTEGRQWLRRVVDMRNHRLTFSQHREVLTLAGWLTLLVGCVENDMGNRHAAESTRRAALSLGEEAGVPEIIGWAHEMRAWFALTSNDYPGIIAASKAGTLVAGKRGVAVQLLALEAKAWARVGDRRQMEVALERGRSLLDSLPYPDNLDHHFVVDPTKFDFYAMDCYLNVGDNSLASNYADQVIQSGTDPDGTERSPMRVAEARLALGILAARQGDASQAARYGHRALVGGRRSLPSLLLIGGQLDDVLHELFPKSPATSEFNTHLRDLRSPTRAAEPS